MDENFDLCCDFVVKKLEGKPSNDPADPGKFTIWGLSVVYNPEVTPKTTYEEAKAIYRKKYWTRECSQAPFPIDLVLFDGYVNPQDDPALVGSGNEELINYLGPWKENPDHYAWAYAFLIMRCGRYARRSKDKHVRGHVQRMERLMKFAEQQRKKK